MRWSTNAAAYLAGAVLFALMLGTTADVVGRAVFNLPLIGMFDLTHFAVLLMVFLGLGYCAYRGGHIVIELLFDRLPDWLKAPLIRLINLVGAVLFGVLAWRAIVQSGTVRQLGEASQLLEVPKFPFYWVMAAGAALFALVLLYRVLVPGKIGDDPTGGGPTGGEPAAEAARDAKVDNR